VTARLLYELEALDREREAREEALALVEGELGQRQEVAQAEEAVAEAQRYLQELQKEERDSNYALDDLQHKIKEMEAKLYSGKVNNPKELSSMQQDVEFLAEKRKNSEDKVLAVMEKIEDARESLHNRMVYLRDVELKWQKRQQELVGEQGELKAAIASLNSQREAQASRIQASHLRQYEETRQRRRPAVARVEQGMCQGCRIALPVGLMQRARGQELVPCPSCGRILFQP
jgi:predicted  nucleic acid-binding Zn-ribbon protein